MNEIVCPKCKSKNVIKKGIRKTRFGLVQIYQCKKCIRLFRNKSLPYITYHPRIIYQALNHYNLGFSLQKTSSLINKQFKVKTSKTTIHSWVKKYQSLCPIVSFRNQYKNSGDVVFKKSFKHENLPYEFIYHKYKLHRYAARRFPALVSYIRGFEQGCPDEFFEIGERCSQPKFKVDVKVKSQVNLACRMADFAVCAKRNNRDRHSLVENFMIINDTATIACELPVWYWEKSIDSGVTGHIDMVQIRGGNVVILDYKPGAKRDRKAAKQLYHYAVALSFRGKVPFERIRCAWFDESGYFEYSPKLASAKLITWK
jgi:transposase-like protein